MSIARFRLQLVRDVIFITDEQRERYGVILGHIWLFQVRGHNFIKLRVGLRSNIEYVNHISLREYQIIFQMKLKALQKEGIPEKQESDSIDFGIIFWRLKRLPARNLKSSKLKQELFWFCRRF